MKYLGLGCRLIPIVITFGAPIFFFVTYGIALANDHISAFWPYISDTGAYPPESCIFGLFVNTIGYSFFIVVYLKYRIIEEAIRLNPSIGVKRWWNNLSVILGCVSSFGLIMVANFEETSQIFVHLTGALMAFFLGTVYSALQTVFGLKMYPNEKKIFWFRTFLTSFSVVSVVGFLAPMAPAMQQFTGKDYLKWTSKDGGFHLHLTSTIFEWFFMFAYCAFFFTIFLDFRKVRILPPQIQFLDVEGDSRKTDSDPIA